MGFVAILIGLAVAGFVIFCFILYWMMMAALIALGVLLFFWYWVFIDIFNGQFIAVPSAIIATCLTIWVFVALIDKSDKKKTRGYY